jgi:hypothetical protein
MFDHPTATADQRHRAFFDRSGEVRQVWARQADGALFYLADGGVTDHVRAAARSGQLTCPYPGCPDPRFIAKGGTERRHHFAHQVAGQEHRTTAAWRHQALLMLAEWSGRHYPELEVDIDDREEGESLRLRSPRSGKVVRVTVTYDRRYELPTPRRGEQLLLGHSRALLLPRREVPGAPGRWWCGEGRLVGDLLAERGWALAVNPQERLVATIADAGLGREAGLVQGRSGAMLLCVVDTLEEARLDADGLHTRAGDALEKALDRRRAAEAELARRLKEAEARARDRERARMAEFERRRAEPAPYRGAEALPTVPQWPARSRAVEVLADEDQEWPTDLEALRRLLGDDELARRVEEPLPTDVECDVPPAIWHLMAVLEAQRRGDNPHPMAVRAAIVARCGYALTREAIAGVLAVAGDSGEMAGRP